MSDQPPTDLTSVGKGTWTADPNRPHGAWGIFPNLNVTQNVNQTTIATSSFPPASELSRIERLSPGATSIIVKMAQDEQAAVIRAERRRFWATSIISGLSIIVGGLLFAGVLFVIYLLAMGGHDWVAGTLAATGVFAVIGALWQTQKPKN